MKDFLEFLSSDIEKANLPGDGGHRNYTRLKIKAPKKKTYMLMCCGTEDSSLKDFVRIQKLLKNAQIKVPEIYKSDFKKGLLLLEDLGDVTLEQVVEKKDINSTLPLYFQAIEELICFQSTVKLQAPRFGKDFFIKETLTALENMESFYRKKFKNSKLFKTFHKGFLQDMENISSQLEEAPFTFCHRDFHSRNLMVIKEQVRTIDFQDGGYGPFCYDLTSLFYDSYVFLKEELHRKLLFFYWDRLPETLKKKIRSFERADFFIRLQFLQRGFKACGCFAGFYANGNKSTHLKYMPETLKRLEQVAQCLSYNNIASYVKTYRQQLSQPPYIDPV